MLPLKSEPFGAEEDPLGFPPVERGQDAENSHLAAPGPTRILCILPSCALKEADGARASSRGSNSL